MSGLSNIYGFAFFNALSFQIVLGSPMVLYAKSLGASATTLGVIAGMLPLLVILQIPSARYVDAVGYKRFVLSGWTVRTVFVGFLVGVPLLSDRLPPDARLSLVLVILFLFNLTRGISSCGWLPWISSIIPPSERGRILTKEASMGNLASFGVFCWAALVLGPGLEPEPWRFAVLFTFSMLCGAISLRFLRRIPKEGEIKVQELPPRPRLPEMLRNLAFRRLLEFNIIWPWASGGVVTFFVAYLKGHENWPDQDILVVSSVIFIGGLANQFLLARLLDRVGSKPILVAGSVLWAGLMAGMVLVASGMVALSAVLAGGVFFCIGMFSSMLNLANLRLALLTVPESGRTHYFAVHSVVGGVSLGLAPIFWGVMLDVWGARRIAAGPMDINGYTGLFCGFGLLTVVLFAQSVRVVEGEGEPVKMERLLRDALGGWRIRYWLRALFRVPPKS